MLFFFNWDCVNIMEICWWRDSLCCSHNLFLLPPFIVSVCLRRYLGTQVNTYIILKEMHSRLPFGQRRLHGSHVTHITRIMSRYRERVYRFIKIGLTFAYCRRLWMVLCRFGQFCVKLLMHATSCLIWQSSLSICSKIYNLFGSSPFISVA